MHRVRACLCVLVLLIVTSCDRRGGFISVNRHPELSKQGVNRYSDIHLFGDVRPHDYRIVAASVALVSHACSDPAPLGSATVRDLGEIEITCGPEDESEDAVVRYDASL